jgi:hypothetical protein
MSQIASGSGRAARDQLVFAVVLIVVGALGLATRFWQPTPNVGGWIVAAIGLAFLGTFVYTRTYGYIVPGGVMTGLGLGIVVSQSLTFAGGEGEGGAVVLGLGLGFVSIAVIGTLMKLEQPTWWALIPGGILGTIGTLLLVGGGAVQLLDWWGVALILLGLVVVVRALTTRKPTI